MYTILCLYLAYYRDRINVLNNQFCGFLGFGVSSYEMYVHSDELPLCICLSVKGSMQSEFCGFRFLRL